jgi:hypothetical protein
MAASDYVPIFFKNRLHLAGRPQMSLASTRASNRESLQTYVGWSSPVIEGTNLPCAGSCPCQC